MNVFSYTYFTIKELNITSSCANVSIRCACGLYLLMFCGTEGRTNIWAVKCIPCIPVCSRAVRGFVPAVGVNCLSVL